MIDAEKAYELKKRFPNAVLLPVRYLEEEGRNKLPSTLAAGISMLTGMPVVDDVLQVEHIGRREKDEIDRLLTIAKFDGKVVPGREYILVDDGVGQGGTLSELRHYIENRGGKFVATTAFGAGIFAHRLSVKSETIKRIKAKHGRYETEQFLKEYDVAWNLEALTEKQARRILSQDPTDALRSEAGKRGYEPVYKVRDGEFFRRVQGSEKESVLKITSEAAPVITASDVRAIFPKAFVAVTAVSSCL